MNPAFSASIYPGFLQGQRAILEQKIREQQLRQALMQQASQGAAFRGLLDYQQQSPVPYATPMGGAAPLGPMASPGAPQPPAQGGTAPAPAGAPPPMQRPPGASPAPGGVPPGSAGGGVPYTGFGMMDVRSLARTIKDRNPGIDDVTLFQAVAQAQHLLSPDARAQVQLLGAELRAMSAQNALDLRDKIAGMVDARMRDIAGGVQAGATSRVAAQQAGAASRVAEQQAGAASRSAGHEAGATSRAATRGNDNTVKQQRSLYAGQIRDINTNISEIMRGRDMTMLTPQEKAQVQQLQSARDNIRQKDADLVAKLKRSGATAEPLAALVAAAGMDVPPPELPDPTTLAEGTTASKGNVTWTVKGGKWVKATP